MGYFSILCVSGLCLLATYYVIQVQHRRGFARANGCRPPKKYPHKDPILGLDLFFQTGKTLQENRYLPELTKRYGELGSTFQSKSLGSFVINSIRPENIQAVWSTMFKDWGVGPVRLPAQDPFCGHGFITTDGPEWEHSRALLKPSFNRANAIDLPTLESYLKKLIDKIPRDGSTVDLQPLLFSLYLDTATLYLFGESFDSLSGDTSVEAQEFLKAFDNSLFGSGLRIALGPFKLLFRDTKWRESCKVTHKFADRYVEKALDYRKKFISKSTQSALDQKSDRRHILLYAMAEQTDDRTDLRNQILQALMAAQETTAALISNVIFLLARHPDVWQELRKEVVSLRDTRLDIDVLQSMVYLRNVLNETLRLHPVFPQMNRVALNDTTLPVGGGSDGSSPIHIPAGTMFDTSWYVLHRLSSIWGPDAEIFKPERWNTFKPGAWEYVPFGGGPRGCVGRTKALTEASYVIVRVLQSFSQIESRDNKAWTGHVQLTAKNANGCKVSLLPV